MNNASIHIHPRRVWQFIRAMIVVDCVFQSTHPRKVWPCDEQGSLRYFESQSTHPRRVWHRNGRGCLPTGLFQSTHPRRVWLHDCQDIRYSSGFNPHTHAGCDFLHGGNLASRRSFNPHTHAGCDTILPQSWRSLPVSIHTPTQGVTQDKRQCKECLRVSIHTPTQGVTYQPLNYLYYYHCFNPPTHAGCDLLAGCCVSF